MTDNSVKPEGIIEINQSRRYDINALRVYALILLIIFHTAMIFSLYTYYFIQNQDLSFTLFMFVIFVDIFHMPLFFLIAGMSTFYSLNKRTGKEYARERFKRLVIPLILGIFIIIPIIVYFERLAWWSETRYHPINFDGSLLEFYPHYFLTGIDWYHLWFIGYLTLISFIVLPFVLKYRKKTNKQSTSRINTFAQGRNVFLYAIPLVLINIFLRWIFPGYSKLIIDDWAHVFLYLTIFAYGFFIVSDKQLEDSMDRNKKLALHLAINLSICVLVLILISSTEPLMYVLYWTLWSLCCWCWLIAIYGYGKKSLTEENKFISRLSEIALPMYLIHLAVIIAIGFFVIQWPLHWSLKFVIITISSFFMTVFLAELIKTNNITRFMFGMRPKENKRSE